MKTIVYIDGFNFYYGCLKGTAYHTVDLVGLFRDCLLPSSSGVQSELAQVHYFTSPVCGGIVSPSQARQPDTAAELHKGVYGACNRQPHKEAASLLRIWRMEERQADVRLALEFLHDAINGDAEQLVLCTADTDLLPAIEMVRMKKPGLRLGLVMPSRHESRKPHPELKRLADWCRAVVRPEELAACAS